MGAVWKFSVFVLTVWLAKGSVWSVNGATEGQDEGTQKGQIVKMENNELEAGTSMKSVKHQTKTQDYDLSNDAVSGNQTSGAPGVDDSDHADNQTLVPPVSDVGDQAPETTTTPEAPETTPEAPTTTKAPTTSHHQGPDDDDDHQGPDDDDDHQGPDDQSGLR
ncbi:DNA mismatch repair protein Msh6-like [Parambassis ranga]|uniref:DNA mismatch repair protein Msh6-like n=1 Tax=Parambassis ranga TaxID=210632 RepID=A0A6P7IFD9_9TELE|nr:DNA mismatch repair protein Msh6-like [Parambassis ranga]